MFKKMPSGILRSGPFGTARANPNCKVMICVKYSSCSRKYTPTAVLLKMMQRESPFHYYTTKVLQILRNFKLILVMGLLFFSSFSSDAWGREACLVLVTQQKKIIGKHKFMDPRMAG